MSQLKDGVIQTSLSELAVNDLALLLLLCVREFLTHEPALASSPGSPYV